MGLEGFFAKVLGLEGEKEGVEKTGSLEDTPESAHTQREREESERIGNIIFWTYQIAQGKSGIQKMVFEALMHTHPELAETMRRYHARAFTRANGYAGDPGFEATLQRIKKYLQNKRSHRQSFSDDTIQRSLTGEYQTANQAAGDGARVGSREEQLLHLVNSLADIDLAYARTSLEEAERHQGERDAGIDERSKARMALGGSFLVAYALSDERDKARAHLPKELQDLWEEIGIFINTHPELLPPDTRNAVAQLKEIAAKLAALKHAN